MRASLPKPSTGLYLTRATAFALALVALSGCGIQARKKTLRVAVEQRSETFSARHSSGDAAAEARTLERSVTANTDAATLVQLAELCDRAGLQAADGREWHRDAAVYAAFALVATPDQCCAEHAAAIYNRNVEKLLRLAQSRRVLHDRCWQQTWADIDVAITGPPFLAPNRFANLQIASDYKVDGLQENYRNAGVGVPIVAYRENCRECPVEPNDRYYSYEIHAAATAVLQPGGTPADWRQHRTVLALFDPFETRWVELAGRSVEMATDRSTPLAVQEKLSSLEILRRVGVVRPDSVMKAERGLYMYQPYQPGKIPIVFSHGIYSSPSTWAQTVNQIQNDPVLSERYQVWLFLYPTGNPLTVSAADLRNTLRDAIEFFDPNGADPALRQMVLVGHSMGGVISKMQVMDTGDALWHAYFAPEFDEVKAPPHVKERLRETLFLECSPYVGRLVLIATPHRGSIQACLLPGQLVQTMIHRPYELRETIRELSNQNGRDVAAPGVRTRPLNGVGGLSPHDPALEVLEHTKICVPFHSIIPQLEVCGHDLRTDGIVGYRSSHLEGAESETFTKGFHTTHDSREVTAELKRILRQHLEQVDSRKTCPPPPREVAEKATPVSPCPLP